MRQGDAAWHHGGGFEPALFKLALDPGQATDRADAAGHQPTRRPLEDLLHGLLDPLATDRRAKADQAARVARVALVALVALVARVALHGGHEAALQLGPQGATPAPA